MKPVRDDGEDSEDEPTMPYRSAVQLDHSDTTRHDSCPGIPLDWPLPNVYSTYPFQRHGNATCDPGYYLSGTKQNGAEIWIKANGCTRRAFADGSACLPCQDARHKRDHLADLAKRSVLPHTSNKLRTHEQLSTRTQELWSEVESLKLKVRRS